MLTFMRRLMKFILSVGTDLLRAFIFYMRNCLSEIQVGVQPWLSG